MSSRRWMGPILGLVWLSACGSSELGQSDVRPMEPGPGSGGGLAVPNATGGTIGSTGGSNTGGTNPAATGGTVGSTGGSSGGTRPLDDNAAALSEQAQVELATLRSALADLSSLGPTELAARHPVAHSALSYDPLTAKYLDVISASALAPSEAELAILGRQGFVISGSRTFCSFYHGFDAIYAADLPLFVSADAILDAVHRSYDSALKQVETAWLVSTVKSLLEGMRTSLAQSSSVSVETRSDVDLYLGVALTLLTGTAATPVAGGSAETQAALVQAAQLASGIEQLVLFGQEQLLDWSQFLPRGHYADDPTLGRYFRAMMWLGRVPLRLIATQSNGLQVFERRQFDASLLLTELLGTDGLARWQGVERVLSAFVGEKDNMTPAEMPRLLQDLGAQTLADTAAIDDATLMNAVLKGDYGAQRIASQLIVNGIGTTLPLDRAFLLFGQRYVIDSHVFSNVVYDRIANGAVYRMMPNPLDVAYAALGNDDALPLLQGELTQYAYAPNLEGMRLLVDAHGPDYWGGSLYTRWVDALRALSPVPALTVGAGQSLPAVAKTESWGRRMLSTELGSWAELRHDTLLYAKQSYTGWPSCEYPDAYVDPYPEFYSRLVKLAEKGAEVAATVAESSGQPQDALRTYFGNLQSTASMLHDMAVAELTGVPFTQAQIDFINRAVRFQTVDMVCAKVQVPAGWYVDLFFSSGDVDACKPTIADVHTQPADEAGNQVGRVLHVGTGYPRLMVATVDTCTGPKAYAGVVFAYHERITENFQRLTDADWQTELSTQSPPEVPWMADLVAR